MSFLTTLEQFHFLRPLWLFGLIPVAFVGWKLWNLGMQSGQWQKLIPNHLLEHLLEGEEQSHSRLPAVLITIAGMIAVIALAGPAWRQLSTPVEKSRAPLVLVVDLSRSMLAADPKPNRMVRAKQKLTDIVRLRKDGLTALVAYAGDSHVVTPLTDDSGTLINMVRALNPDIMPVPGSRPEKGIEQAIALMKQGAGQAGTILLLTDGMEKDQSQKIEKLVKSSGNRHSIPGFGAANGAPIPADGGVFQRDRDGAIVMAQLDRELLAQTAQATSGHYSDLTLNDSDILSLIPQVSLLDQTERVDRNFDNWHDEGRWLVLLLTPFAAFGFRRGWILPVLLVGVFSLHPRPSYALEWNDLWETQDQQAQKLLNSGDAKAAAETFQNQNWKAEALDKSGNHEEAAKLFGQQNTAEGFFNQGNALARAGKLEESLKAYDKALEKNPELEAASKNKKVVEDLKKQQQQNQDQNQKSQDNQQDKQDDSKDQQNQKGSDQSQDQQSDDKQKGDDSQSKSDQQKDQQNANDPNKDQEQNSDQSSSDDQKDQQQKQGQSEQGQDEKEQQPQPAPDNQESQDQNDQEQQMQAEAGEESDQQNPDKKQIEAWLRRIPDDPGGLLRRKFEQQEQQRKRPVQQGEKTW